MSDEIADHLLDGGVGDAPFNQFLYHLFIVGALVRFLPREEFRVHGQAVLQVVDAQRSRFAKTYRAKVTSYLYAPLMGRSDCGTKHGTRDKVVNLEIVHATVDPEIYGRLSILGSLKLRHLRGPTPGSLQIGSRHVHVWAGDLAPIDLLFDLEVSVGLDAPSRADAGHAAGKIETGKAYRHFVKDPFTRGVKHVIVHTDKSGDDRFSTQIKDPSLLRHCRRGSIPDPFDPTLAHDRLIFQRRRARAIDHSDVTEHDYSGAYLDEFLHLRRQGLCR